MNPDEKNNADMAATIQSNIIGRSITGFTIQGRRICITIDNGTEVILEDTESFEIHAGEWRFVPTAPVGRPRKSPKPANAPAALEVVKQ